MSEQVMATTEGLPNGSSVLICGASFAGLATAWWMTRLGYAVTIVELAKDLRKGGTPVDIREGVLAVVERMGLLHRIAARSLPPRPTEFLDGTGARIGIRPGEQPGQPTPQPDYEIERDDLLDLLLEEVKDHAEFRFGDTIVDLQQSPEAVTVTFQSGATRSFSLVVGCDGTHSAVRRLCFGEESSFLLFLNFYFSLTIVNDLLIPENTSQMFNIPGKIIMLNAYHGKTDIAFSFFSQDEVSYDRRNRDEQRRMIAEQFTGLGWKTADLLKEIAACDDFYFDKLCQVRMDSWVRGRVALVGDAGYCPSPAAGLGGSMALLGAAALGDALQKHPTDFRQAFAAYDHQFRPVVDEIQQGAIDFGMALFLPQTEEGIERRNKRLNLV